MLNAKMMQASPWQTPGEYLKSRQKTWILGFDQAHWIQAIAKHLEALDQYPGNTPRVLVLRSDPMALLAAFMACAIARCPIFLGNPSWKQRETQQAIAIAQPHLIWSDLGHQVVSTVNTNPAESGWIMIPTGGTSGQIKFAIHTWDSLGAAVSGMQDFFFGEIPEPIHSCCILPLHHVSGLMQFMRSLLTGGWFVSLPFKTFLNGSSSNSTLNPFLNPQSRSHQTFFLSLVPTQLSRLFNQWSPQRLEWLAQFQCILLGGAPASSQILAQSLQYQLNLAPTYGMTETGAQVMTLRPQHFRQGQSPPGEILPHISLNILAPPHHTGPMQWSGPSICLGYYPTVETSQVFLTDDLAKQDENGQLHMIGRASRKLLSGGENIYPEEIEAILMAMTEITDACVFGMPDSDWGEIAIAAYVTSNPLLSDQLLTQRVKATLAAYKCPKIWWRLPTIPHNAQGKVNIKKLKEDWRSASICNSHVLDPKPPD